MEEIFIIEKLNSKPISKCEKEWEIAIRSSAIAAERARFFQQIAPDAQVPGFRKGKAPFSVLEQHFKDKAQSEIVERLLSRSVREAILREKEDIIHYPAVRDIQFNGDRLSFKIYIELRPKIKLPRYQRIKAKRPPVNVSDEDISKVVERMRERSATFGVVSGRPAKMGDFVIADYSLAVEGKEREKKSDELFELKDEPLLPGFANQICGMSVGETRTITVNLPESFPRKDWANKSATFTLTLKDIKIKQLPEADDNWAVSISNFKSVNEVRDQIRTDLLRMKEREAEAALERALLDELVAQTKFDIAEGSIARRAHYLNEQSKKHFIEHGYAPDKAELMTEERTDEVRKTAERQVRVTLILEEIAKEQKIEVSDAEVDARIEESAAADRNPDEWRSAYANEERREALCDQMRYERVIDFLKAIVAKD